MWVGARRPATRWQKGNAFCLTGYGPRAGGDKRPISPCRKRYRRCRTPAGAGARVQLLVPLSRHHDPDDTAGVMAETTATSEFHIEKLDTDYMTWATLFQAMLEDKMLWEAISEEAPDVATDPTGHAEWKKKDRRALARIKMGVALHHLPSVSACASAKVAWDALESMFSAQNATRRLHLGRELAELRIKSGESVLAYSGRVKRLHAQLVGAGHPIDETTAKFHFLNGLPDDYAMEKKLLTNQGGDVLRWATTLPMLYPVEETIKDKAAAIEGPSTGAFGAWPRNTPMPRSERKRRVCQVMHVGPFMRVAVAAPRPPLYLPPESPADRPGISRL